MSDFLLHPWWILSSSVHNSNAVCLTPMKSLIPARNTFARSRVIAFMVFFLASTYQLCCDADASLVQFLSPERSNSFVCKYALTRRHQFTKSSAVVNFCSFVNFVSVENGVEFCVSAYIGRIDRSLVFILRQCHHARLKACTCYFLCSLFFLHRPRNSLM